MDLLESVSLDARKTVISVQTFIEFRKTTISAETFIKNLNLSDFRTSKVRLSADKSSEFREKVRFSAEMSSIFRKYRKSRSPNVYDRAQGSALAMSKDKALDLRTESFYRRTCEDLTTARPEGRRISGSFASRARCWFPKKRPWFAWGRRINLQTLCVQKHDVP